MGPGIERHRILGRQPPCRGEVGDDAQAVEPGADADDAERVVEQGYIAAELVDEVAVHQSPLGCLQQVPGADETRQRAAALDVGNDQHGYPRRHGEAHIGDVAGAQIDLGRTARALDQDQLGVFREAGEALQHPRHQARLQRVVVTGAGAALDPSLDHNLTASLALGLQEHRVHVDRGRGAAGARLQRLGTADLAARRDGGVVGHVLRLERPHRQPPSRKGPAQAGDDQRLADMGAGALDHQGRGGAYVIAVWQGHRAGIWRGGC